MLKLNKVYCGNCKELLKEIDRETIDLVITSPPYDNLKKYEGYSFDFEIIAQELYRVIKQHGVVVWIVGDAVIDGSETGTSFKQALYFKEIGFNIHDTMIYEKNSSTFPARRDGNRYTQIFEYCFVFCKPDKIISKYPILSPKLKIEDASWLAAAIDGEGCFRIRKHGKNGSCYSNINLGNMNKEYVKKAFDITGLGNFWYDKNRNFYEWNVGSEDASKIVLEIYPYLLIKKEQAKTLINFQEYLRKENDKGGRNKVLSKKDKEKRLNFFDIMKQLNDGSIRESGFGEIDTTVRSKGKPKTANLLCDKPNKWAGVTSYDKKIPPVPDFSPRTNIWWYVTSFEDKNDHPAIFPEKLAWDHILSWSDKGDIVLDPMCGSGTTLKAAKELGRHFIGMDVSERYCGMSRKRISNINPCVDPDFV